MSNELSALQAIQIFAAIGEALTAGIGWQEMLERVLQSTVQHIGYKAASVRLLDPERQVLKLQAAVGLSDQYLGKGPVEVAQSPVDRTVLRGEAVALDDLKADQWQYPEAAQAEGIRSVLAVPLRMRMRYLGVLRVYTAEAHHFSEEEQLLLSAIGGFVARMTRNMNFYHAMHTIAAEVNSSLELQKVLDALLRSVIEQVNCKAASIRLLGPKQRRLHLVATQGLSEQYLQKGEVVVEESPIDRQVLQGKVAMIYDVERETGLQYTAQALAEGIRSVLAVPLDVHEQIIGVLRVYSAQPYRFNEDEVAFLQTAADLGAIAIDNARLYEELNEKYEAARDDWAGWYRFLALS